MAKITLGTLAVDARNKLGNITHRVPPKSAGPLEAYQGGLVFIRSRAGHVARSYVEPRYQRTDAQAAFRDCMKAAVAYWQQNLTDPMRAAWDATAATQARQSTLACPRPLSGYQTFIRHAYLATCAGFPPLDWPPASLAVGQLLSLTIDTNTQDPQSLCFTCTYPATFNDSIWIYGTHQLSPGRRTFGHLMSWIDYLDPPYTWPHDGTEDYVNTFGPLAAGKRVGLAARPFSTTNFVQGIQLIASSITA